MFLPREKKFFDLYEALADKIIEAVENLESLIRNYENLPQISERLNQIENEADAICHQIIYDLHYDSTRVTEEKGDIRFFVHNMDNVIDSIEKAVNRLYIYQVKTLPPGLPEFLPFLKQTALEIKAAVSCLRDIGKKDQVLAECCVKINDLEDEADEVNRKWLAHIMVNNYATVDDFRKNIALKEVIDLLEYAMDQCEDVANVLETFRLKGHS